MRNLICAALLLGLVCIPGQSCFAMGADFDIRLTKVEDHVVSEIWFDHTLFWRIAFSPSGAMPVTTNSAKYQTVITPSFEHGFFLFNVK